ncbi:MAG: hypothetical protein R2705_07235 [Ilumatobacteraceae bacterium]
MNTALPSLAVLGCAAARSTPRGAAEIENAVIAITGATSAAPSLTG